MAREDIQTMTRREDEPAPQRVAEPPPERRGFGWRFEYSLLIGVALLVTAFAIAFFYFGADTSNLESWGYAGVFIINLVGSASILLPSPAAASTVGGGALLGDFLGVPAFIWVGLIAGLGETVGEFSGYAAGYGGRVVFENRPEYVRVYRWMERRGAVTMFLLSVFPNPLFDLAGVAAGAVRMPVRRFFFSVLPGKVIKDIYIAGIGGLGATIFEHLL
jgi:membrane protein DedA with SNARE-associated domain